MVLTPNFTALASVYRTNRPSSKMDYFVDNLFKNHVAFFNEWKDFTPDVIAALELVSIASKADNSGL